VLKLGSPGPAFAGEVAPAISPMRAPRWAFAGLSAICLGLASIDMARAATAYSADAVKAEFIYRFAGYVEWPVELAENAKFTIAVAGADGVTSQLQQLLPGRTIQNRGVEIRKVSSVADLDRVQILYVPSASQTSARTLLAASVGRPILIVTDEPGALASGSVVNFLEVNRHVRFEISLTAAERSRLKINSGLLSVAAYVEGRPRADASCWPATTFGARRAHGVAASCVWRAALAANHAGTAAGGIAHHAMDAS